MAAVTVSPGYRIGIPKDMREKLHLSPGQKVEAVAYEGRIELIPVMPIGKMRGFLKGLDTRIEREADRI